MTNFERFVLPQGTAEIEAALEGAFRTFRMNVPRCVLIGAQDNTLVEITVHATGREPFRFTVAQEDVIDGSLAGKIEMALRAAGGTPEIM